jgi:hypothetical protein
LPQKVDLADGYLSIDNSVVLVNNPLFQNAVQVVDDALSSALGSVILRNDSPAGKVNIRFIADNTLDTREFQIAVAVN